MDKKIIELEKFIFEQFKEYDEFPESDPVLFVKGIMLEIASTMFDECLKHYVFDGNPEVWMEKLLVMKKKMLSYYA